MLGELRATRKAGSGKNATCPYLLAPVSTAPVLYPLRAAAHQLLTPAKSPHHLACSTVVSEDRDWNRFQDNMSQHAIVPIIINEDRH